MKYDAIIVGGGAAGLFCAIEAGKRGRRVLVIEHNAKPGRKILISGGGRCNFTNLDVSAANFVSENPHFCKSALARYTPLDFVELVKKHRIGYYEKKLGQLFCRDISSQIVDMLLAECAAANVDIEVDCSVKKVGRNQLFEVETTRAAHTAESLVIATGGLSFPKIGASAFGYEIAKQFSIKQVQTRPSLVALVFSNPGKYAKMAGLSIDSIVSTGGKDFRENILFTHRGLSGPAILQISNYWQKRTPVTLNLLPDRSVKDEMAAARADKVYLANFLSRSIPKRFADEFTADNFENKPLNQLSNAEIDRISDLVNGWPVEFGETEGYDRAEVTLGGVSTSELSSQTMESKKIRGLYFIGEVVDVTGWLGGYNFQWAWSSGFAAGQSI